MFISLLKSRDRTSLKVFYASNVLLACIGFLCKWFCFKLIEDFLVTFLMKKRHCIDCLKKLKLLCFLFYFLLLSSSFSNIFRPFVLKYCHCQAFRCLDLKFKSNERKGFACLQTNIFPFYHAITESAYVLQILGLCTLNRLNLSPS